MLTFEWNALRVGDRVMVHDNAMGNLALIPGTVAMVDMRRGTNLVGIRIVSTNVGHVLWPSSLVAHHDPKQLTEPCWRCKEVIAAAAA